MRKRRVRWLVSLAGVVLAFLASGVVREAPTRDDIAALLTYRVMDVLDIGRAESLDMAGQQALLSDIVQRVHASIGRLDPLQLGQPREPSDVLKAGTGVCFDRSRVIEKAARLAGFETRRVFLLYGGWRQLLIPQTPSHTLVEAKTRRGWVFLGTLTPVSGFAPDGRVWSARDLQGDVAIGSKHLVAYGWREVLPRDFVPLYGLYSRHGGHYWPYTPMPDFSPQQVLQGMLGDASS